MSAMSLGVGGGELPSFVLDRPFFAMVVHGPTGLFVFFLTRFVVFLFWFILFCLFECQV